MTKFDINFKKPSEQQLDRLLEHYQGGRYEDAEKLSLSITQEFPEHQFAWKVLATVLMLKGKMSESLVACQKSLQLGPEDSKAHYNLANTLKKLGRLDEAEKSYRQSIILKPKFTEAHFNLGDTLKILGKLDEAEASYRQVIKLNPNLAETYNNLGIILQELGRLDEAEVNYRQATMLKPGLAKAHNNLGTMLQKLGKLKQAEKSYKKTINLESDCAEAHYNLGNTFKELGKLDEAEASYRQAITLKFDYVEAHNNLGITLQQLGKLDEAEASYRKATTLKPDYADAHYNLGNSLKELCRLDEAKASYRQAIIFKPNYAKAYNNLGITMKELGRLDMAEASYRQAIILKPDYAESHTNLGDTLKEIGKLDEAEKSYRMSIMLQPKLIEAHNNLGVIMQELGKLDEAEANYKQSITLKPDFTEGHLNLVSIKRFNSQDEHFLKMQELYFNKNLSEEQLCHINFSLAKACEDLQDFKQAFQHYKEGNEMRKKILNYDISEDIKLFRQLKSNYTRIEQNSLEPENLTTNLIPIFIVGMPRSGTTLVEQIISSHSEATGAGELDFINDFGSEIAKGLSNVNKNVLLNFREKYLTKLQNFSNGNMIVTDKMPLNFRYIGLLTAAFPEAKIIHVKRNAAALCWSNYKKYFASESLGYCYALDDVISYYRLYEDLMQFWRNSLNKRIYNLDYELLTVNQENVTHHLINYLGLDWDKNCLSPQDNKRSVSTASNVQIRKKVYRGSSEQWKKYKPFLNDELDFFDDL